MNEICLGAGYNCLLATDGREELKMFRMKAGESKKEASPARLLFTGVSPLLLCIPFNV